MHSKGITLLFFVYAIISLTGCVGEGALKLPYQDSPTDLGDDWTIDTPASQGIQETAIQEAYTRFFSDSEFLNGISLLVIRNGVLVAEAYARDPKDQTHYEAAQSITKSITSLLTGIAIDEGVLTSLDMSIGEIYPDKLTAHTDKSDITLAQLLTMSSGIAFDNNDFHVELNNNGPSDTIDYILSKPTYNTPGSEFYYRDADPHLLSYALQTLSGETLASFAKTRLFQPLGINNYQWLEDRNGITYGAYGVYLTPRDLAKIGQMVLQNGLWNGQQLVSSSWLATSTQKQIENDSPETKNYEYGYYWWVIPELNAFTAWGHGGNFISILPDKQMVVVLTSFPNSGTGAGTHLDEFMPILRLLHQAAN